MGQIVNRSKTVVGKGGVKGVNISEVKDNLILTLIVLHVPVVFCREKMKVYNEMVKLTLYICVCLQYGDTAS